MSVLRLAVSLLVALLPAPGYGSICMLHNFHEKFYTDLNQMIRENGSFHWYVLAFEKPELPYRTLYHLPTDLATNRNCYSYRLTTRFGVIFMDFRCRWGKAALQSFEILTRPNGAYVASVRGPREVSDFRTVHVLQLTREIVLLVSCSGAMHTYGVLVLHRGPWQPAQDEAYFHRLIIAKFPESLYRWMNFTVTSAPVGDQRCNCTEPYTIAGRTDGEVAEEQDKRKVFIVITLGAATVIGVIVKFLKRLF